MTSTSNPAREELSAYIPSDPVIADVLQRAWSVITKSDIVAELEELHLFILNPEKASTDLLSSKYFTKSCQAQRDEMIIIVNEQFLLELEAAIRSFALSESLLGSPYLKSDPQLFGLVRRIQMYLSAYLKRLRRRSERSKVNTDEEERIRQEFMFLTLFFLGHEVGHLLDDYGYGQFSTFIDAAKPLEDQIDEAVVKLCRHVDEFNEYKFDLPGFEHTSKIGSEVRLNVDEYREKDKDRYQRHEAFFANEVDADKWADRLVIEHLNKLAKSDLVESEKSLYLFSRGAFAAALYTWYKDLFIFGQKLSIGNINDAKMLTMKMLDSRENYVYGASLFGEHHRFTLLRATLSLEAVLRARTDWFDQPGDAQSIRCAHDDAKIAKDLTARREWWLSEALKRYYLLCISMDTAVKIANVGAVTGWIKDVDRRRGSPQILLMNFEPINAAVERLNHFA